MASGRIASLDRLIDELKKLPGIGARSAERLAFHILRSSSDQAEALANAITNLKKSIRHCSRCFNLTDREQCGICSDAGRDQSQIWVVEQPKDILALEATGLVRGVYHVLMGHIAPLDGVEPGDLTIESLVQRVKDEKIEELVLATNPTMEGDGTALYLESILEPLKVRTTRLARGLAVGSQLEYATTAMLEAAIRGRS
ncbi:MAG: recombination protein RecR [Planctomycetes bacterium]|nr:recombination protein RecR [Planctomycetota bacterium]MCH8968740.1 recombination protein RecR [Planctomycetota bacterium]